MASKLRCIKINLRHSISATLHLIKLMNDLDIDVALIQEPYANKNIFNNNVIHLPYFPEIYTIHHNLNTEHVYGAAVVTKKVHLAKNITAPSSNHFAGINLTKHNSLSLFSIYYRPTQPLDTILKPLEAHKDLNNTIFCLDSKAKNKMWNSSNTDGKGSELENFIEKNNLNVINKPSKLTYIPKHTSMIDVTIAGDKPKVKSWEYLKDDSLSDHPYIYFEIELEKTYRVHSGKTTVPRIKNLDKSEYLQTLEYSLKTLDIKWSSTETKEEVDAVVETIKNTISASASRSKVPYKLLSKKKLDFWCEELSMLKDSKQKAYNAREMSEANESLYREFKSQYQRLLRKSKEKARRKFMSED